MLSLYRTFLVAFGIVGVPLGSLSFMHSNSPIFQILGILIVTVGIFALFFLIRSFFKGGGCFSFFFLLILVFLIAKFGIGLLGESKIPDVKANLDKGKDRFIAKTEQNQRGSIRLSGEKKDSSELLKESDINEDLQETQRIPAKKKPQFIKGKALAISGDIIKIEDYYIRLFGIDAPEEEQTCADSSGRAYNCGIEAKDNLKSILRGEEILCRIIDFQGHKIVGTCLRGEYDIGAQQVLSGWAVAHTGYSDVYIPYENEAKAKNKGLWKGSFYMPWDYRKNKKY